MDTFLQLNKEKIGPTFIRLSLILLGLVSIVLAIGNLNGSLPNGQLLLFIFLASGIGFPLFMLFLGYIGWLLNHTTRQKAFSKIPFNQIEKIGFYTYHLDHNSKW